MRIKQAYHSLLVPVGFLSLKHSHLAHLFLYLNMNDFESKTKNICSAILKLEVFNIFPLMCMIWFSALLHWCYWRGFTHDLEERSAMQDTQDGKQADSMLLGWCRARSHSSFREGFVRGSSCQLLVQTEFWAQQKELLPSRKASDLPVATQMWDLFPLRGRISWFQPGFCRNKCPFSEETKMKPILGNQTSSVALFILDLGSASPHYNHLDLQTCFSAAGLLKQN